MTSLIDRYAYNNRIRGVDPALKACFVVAVLLICLILDEPAVGLLAAGWMWALAALLAGLPAAAFGRILLAEALFLLLVTMGVAVSLSTVPPSMSGWAFSIGPLWISGTSEGADRAVHLLTRALGGTAAMNFLAMTTPLVDLVDLMRRLRVPGLLVDVMTVMYRYLFVLLDSFERMRLAQDSRLGYASLRRGLTSAGTLGSRVFVDAYRRSERLQTALEARGYQGELKVLPTSYRSNWALLIGAAAALVSLFAVWGAL